MHTEPTWSQIPNARLSDRSCIWRKHYTREKASNEFSQSTGICGLPHSGRVSSEAILSQLSLIASLI